MDDGMETQFAAQLYNFSKVLIANDTALAAESPDGDTYSDILMYIVSSSDLLVNSTPVIMFVVQRWRQPSANRLSPAGVLVLNLLITDALVGAMGIVVTATGVSFNLHPGTLTSTPYGCVHAATKRYFFRIASHMALIYVAINRYIAVMHTLHYREWMPKSRCYVLIGFGWLVPILVTSFAYWANNWAPGHEYCYDVPSFRVYLIYVLLPYQVATLLLVLFILCRTFSYLRSREMKQPQHLQRVSRKSAHVLVWMATPYIICWLPYDIVQPTVMHMHGNLRYKLFPVLRGATVLTYCSFMANAFIFSYKTENIRRPVSDLWRDCKAVACCRMAGTPSRGADKMTIKRRSTISSVAVGTQDMVLHV